MLFLLQSASITLVYLLVNMKGQYFLKCLLTLKVLSNFSLFFKVDGNNSTLSMSVHFKTLKRLVEEHTFSEILIPLQSVMIPTLPSIPGTHANHDPFPGCWAYIAGFDDAVRL